MITRSILSALCCMLIVSCTPTPADKQQAQAGSATYVADATGGIKVVYPPAKANVAAASTFIVGSAEPGSSLTCNGEAVKLTAEGYFSHVVKLQPGANQFKLVESAGGGGQKSLTVDVNRELPTPAISASEFKIDTENAEPKEDRGVVTGDLLELTVHATPNSYVAATIGKRTVVLRPAVAVAAAKARMSHHKRSKTRPHAPANLTVSASASVNQGLDAAYGKVYQRHAGATPDLYVGFYRVAPEDNWQDTPVRLVMKHASRTVTSTARGRITTVAQPLLAQTKNDETIVRLGPNRARTTPLPQGVRFLVDGWQGDQMRCLLAAGHHVWIDKKELAFENDGSDSGPAPRAVVRTINMSNDDYGAVVTLPMNQRLPFRIEQHVHPSKLVLKVFGVTADTDWIGPATLSDAGESKEAAGGSSSNLIDHVTWKQQADDIYEVTVHLKEPRQWGFKGTYDGTDLKLHIKSPPRISTGARQLEGLKICLDPGHGGSETGAIGCSGVREADINLGIGMKLKPLLEQAGAKVTMTRTGDQLVTLAQRVEIARAANVDLLLSIHNNSLPDGRDPWAEHGSSTYWYHPQSILFAKALKQSLVQGVGFPDFGSRYQNLFLCRPSDMPAALVEVGFVINPPEDAVLSSSEGQERAAQSLRDGLVTYFTAM